MQAARTERVEFDGRPAWRKRYGAPERRRRIAALRWLARRLRLTPLLPPAPIGGIEACRTEQAMIARLAALGARVPEVLAAGPADLVLSDLGETLSARCKAEPDPAARAELLRLGFQALSDLHARGGHLSQAFARNLVLQGGQVGFIDLEEDPLTVMPLVAAQARDLLLYLHSTARFLPLADYARLLDRSVGDEPEAVRAELSRVARRLAWLRPLALLGGRRSRAVGQALAVLARL
jgi:hypothetical protein